MNRCPDCHGAGSIHGYQCGLCLGRGELAAPAVPCKRCKGTGRTYDYPCPSCHGQRFTAPAVALEQPPRMFSANTLRQALDKILDGTPDDSYLSGVVGGLYSLAQQRYETTEARARFLSKLVSSGKLIIDGSDVWHVKNGIAARIQRGR